MNALTLTHCTQADRDGNTSRVAPALKASMTAFGIAEGQVPARPVRNGADLHHALGVRSPR
jgi:hypothetical protein